MDIKIINAGVEYLDEITELFNQYMIFYKKSLNELKYKEYLKKRIENNEAQVYLAIKDKNIPLGFVLNYYSFSSVSLGKTVVLNDLFVKPEYRKKGIAEKLINSSFKLAKEVNAIRVDLGTARDNYVAQKLYERIGFMKDEEFYSYSYEIK